MATDTRKIQLGVGVDATGAKAGFQEVKDAARDMATSVTQAGQTASKGIDGMGDGAAGAATKVDRATTNLVGSIQRATAAAETGRKSGADYFEALAKQRNISPNAIKPYLDQLRAIEEQTKRATAAATDFSRVTSSLGASGFVKPLGNPGTSLGATSFGAAAADAAIPAAAEKANQALRASGIQFDKYGNSVKQTQAALRGLPAQFTDIAVSLQGGQNPLTVLLQQGGQLKDMFGGIGPAARAMGGYVMGLVGPFTIAAAALATLGVAYFKGSKETDAFRKSLILTNNIAGTSVGQMTQMAQAVSAVVGTQGAAAAALTALASAGGVSVASWEKFATTAVRVQRTIGTSVEDTAKAFASLADEPLKASEKLNHGVNYLTLSLYDQIKALEEQGKKTEAAAVAQGAYDSAMDTAAKKLEANLGSIEKMVQFVTDGAKGMWDALLDVGRTETLASQIKKSVAEVERLQARTVNNVVGGGGAAGAQSRRRAQGELDEEQAKLSTLMESSRLANRQAAAEGETVRRQKEAVEARKANAKWAEAGLTAQEKTNKALTEYRANNAKIIAGGGTVDPKRIAAEEAAIRKANAGPKGPTPRAFQDDAATKMLQTLREQESSLRQQLTTDEKLTASEKERAKFIQLITDLKEKKQLTAEQKSLLASQDSIKAQLDQNVAIEKQIVLKREAQKLDEQRKKDAEDFARQIEAINIAMASSAESRKDQQDRSLEAFGQGDRARERVDAQRGIRNEFSRYERQLTQKAADEGELGSDKYKAEVERIKQSLNDALNAQSDYFDKLEEKQGDWANGASAAFANYVDEAKNVAGQVEDAFSSGFQGMEDALVKFVQTGKLDFKSLADSIAADITRIIIKQQMMNAIGTSKGGSGWLTSVLGMAAGAAFGTSGSAAVASATPGNSLDNFLKFNNNFVKSANGNVFNSPGLSAYSGTIVDKPTIFPFAKGIGLMGEAGKEAILPLKRGPDGKLGVQAANDGGSGQQLVVNQTINVMPGATRQTAMQAAAEASRALERAQRNR